MVARGLREQLELTQDLLTRGLDAIKELEDAPGGPASAVARHHGHREPDPGRRRPPSEEDPALPGGQPAGPPFRPGGQGPQRVHRQLYARLGPAGAAVSHAGLPPGPLSAVPGIRQGAGPARHQ